MRLEDGVAEQGKMAKGWSELTYLHAGICRFMAVGAFDLNHVLEGQPNLFRCDTRDARGILSTVRIPRSTALQS